MAYAKLAELPVEFGLYTSFMGVLLYWFFATSKDITIGVSLKDDGHHRLFDPGLDVQGRNQHLEASWPDEDRRRHGTHGPRHALYHPLCLYGRSKKMAN